MATGKAVAEREDATYEVKMSPAARSAINSMVADILDETTTDSDSMIDQILSATDWRDVNLGGKIPAFAEIASTPVVVTAIKARHSEMKGGLGFYLVVNGYDDQGVVFTAATSATSVCVQLLQLHTLGQLPVVVTVETSKRPTRSGNYPQRMTVIGKPEE